MGTKFVVNFFEIIVFVQLIKVRTIDINTIFCLCGSARWWCLPPIMIDLHLREQDKGLPPIAIDIGVVGRLQECESDF